MRLGSLLSVVAFRVPTRKVNVKTFVLFVEHLTSLVREQRLRLDDSTDVWGSQILQYLDKPIPLEIESRVWKITKGGFGARDIWDIFNACINSVSKEENQDKKLFSLFVVMSLMPEIAKGLLGGNYGESISKTLYNMLLIHVPESLQIHNNDLKKIFQAFGQFLVRFQENSRKRLKKYLKIISTCIRMEKGKVYNIIYHHFMDWKGVPCNTQVLSVDTIENIMASDERIEVYLQECTSKGKIDLNIKGNTYTIPIDKDMDSHSQSLERVIQECSSSVKLPVGKNPFDVLCVCVREAEFHWEHKDFS